MTQLETAKEILKLYLLFEGVDPSGVPLSVEKVIALKQEAAECSMRLEQK